MVVEENPYTETVNGNIRLRTIKEDVDTDELVWHRDRKDRVVEILESNGWEFQYDNGLPFSLEKGQSIVIPKEIYHRVIKGSGDLVIKIIES
jgi:quercetin dioxygenase-like cupin family protein